MAQPPYPELWSLPLMGIVNNRYRYTEKLLALESCTPSVPPVSWPPCLSPSNLPGLWHFLCSHLDQCFAQYIYWGMSCGFQIGFRHDPVRLNSSLRNHPSSLANPDMVHTSIQAEVQAGRLVGPLPASWSAHVMHSNPLGLVPKACSNRWRMIVDLSSPSGKCE